MFRTAAYAKAVQPQTSLRNLSTLVIYGILHLHRSWPDLLHPLLLLQRLAQSPDHLYAEELHIWES
jgi:hypothetical protein